MKQHKRTLGVLGMLAAIFGGISAFGGIIGNEPVLAIGITLCAFCLLLMPIRHGRAIKKHKIAQKTAAILVFEYSASEAEGIAQEHKGSVRVLSIRLSLLFSVCFFIIFLPFILIARASLSDTALLIAIMMMSMILPWFSVFIAPAVTARKIRRQPCVSVIGYDYIYIANRYIGINDRASLQLKRLVTEPDGQGIKLRALYSFLGGSRYRMIFSKWVDVPVPIHCEQQAREMAERFSKGMKE